MPVWLTGMADKATKLGRRQAHPRAADDFAAIRARWRSYARTR
jgi:hypothetical protein